jgi:hypothetical protein
MSIWCPGKEPPQKSTAVVEVRYSNGDREFGWPSGFDWKSTSRPIREWRWASPTGNVASSGEKTPTTSSYLPSLISLYAGEYEKSGDRKWLYRITTLIAGHLELLE